MTRDILIGIDAGTSVIKAVAFDLAGRQLGVAARQNQVLHPSPGAAEQSMKRTFADCAAVLRALALQVPNLSARALAMGVTGQGDGTWLIDREGEPVHDGWLWLDSRAASLVPEKIARPGYAKLYETTGTGLNACMQSVHLNWMQRHAPNWLARATTAFHCKDYLYFRLTGIRATDPSEGNFTFGSYRTRAYSDEVIAEHGLTDHRALLPPLVDGTEQSHPLTKTAALETGLPEGLPVSLGYLDVVCAALGGGLYDPDGKVGVSILGTTGMHMRFTPRAEDVSLNADRSGYTMLFPVPGSVSQMQSNMVATPNIDWWLDVAREGAMLGGASLERADLLKHMDAIVMNAAPAAALYHPYIADAGERGPFLDANARASFVGFSMEAGYAGMMRAVYEGLAFAARDCFTAMGAIPAEIRVGGGAARSVAIRSILASVLGAKVRTVSREETGAAGAVMIAGVCQGLWPDMATCTKAWVDPALGEASLPDEGLNRLYDDMFPIYRDLRATLAQTWARMAQYRGRLGT